MTAPRTRAGRPRDADATVKVLNATLELLDDRGVAALRIDDIARVSGVAKTTIYRRWTSLTALVVAAMESALGPRAIPETGDVEADLLALTRLVHQSISRTPFIRALPLISVELMQHPGLAQQYRARIIDPVREQAIRLVRAGMKQGRFRPDTDPSLVVDAVISPVIYRRVILHEDLSLPDLLAVGEMILRSIRT
jgi:AcrR family transcriptional regulator